MRIKSLLDRRAVSSFAALGLLLGMAAPAVVPAFASADQLSTRSITMSTSTASATGVTYKVKFTAPTVIGADEEDEGGVIIDFCSNTAVLGDDCTPPSGMEVNPGSNTLSIDEVKYDASDPASDGSVTGSGNHIVWTAGTATEAGDVVELTFGGITNPSDVGIFYARVTTYADGTALGTYEDEESVGTYADEGSMALAVTAGIGVTSYVLEAMSFCVSLGNVGDDSDTGNGSEHAIAENAAPSENCGINENDCDADEVGDPDVQPGCVIAPSMTLGRDDGTGRIVLGSGFVALGQIWAQLSSNASGDTVVNLKSDAIDCGGLYRDGVSNANNCNIEPADSDFSAGAAKFGLKVGTPVGALKANGDPTTGSGTIAPADGSGYNDSTFLMNFVAGNGTGVTSTYGDSLFETDGAVDNMNVPITFGASISSNTPAGTYGANLSLIAVGTF